MPYPDRRAIEEEGAAPSAHPLAYVRDPVELFLIQVQGSARLRLPGGGVMTLTYAGRNGWPYTSVGRLMIERGLVTKAEMSLDLMKETLRRLGAGPGEAGRRLMQENRSYVFFEIDASERRRIGPIGGQGAPLTPFRSIAVDRSIWCYGLPFWIAARIPWQGEAETPFRRLMIAQDTGSAIIGPARADLFFGAGEAAGRRAGRHPARRRNDCAAAEGRWGRSVSEENSRRYARRLSQAEAELWTIATADVRPARARPRKHVSPTPAAEVPAPLSPSGPSAVSDRPMAPKPPPRPIDIDPRTFVKIKRGRIDVDAKLDLHGLRQAEAQRSLTAFLRRCQANGARIAIIVTGKGLTRDEGGVLRRVVPMWLEAPNLRDVVVGFGEAARHHGGEGALYVRIRRADRMR